MSKRSNWMWMIVVVAPVLLLSGFSQGKAPAPADSLPRGVMSAAQACRLIVGKAPPGFFSDPEQVHLVLTSYGKGEPIESQGTISYGAPQTLVWVVEVHAKAINWGHSVPDSDYKAPIETDYSVVMNARTGYVSDAGECPSCWPLPLSKAGTLVSLPPKC
jgi:hypothetical protein